MPDQKSVVPEMKTPEVINLHIELITEEDYLCETISLVLDNLRAFGFCQVAIIANGKIIQEIVEATIYAIKAFELSFDWIREEFKFQFDPIPLNFPSLQSMKKRGIIITIKRDEIPIIEL